MTPERRAELMEDLIGKTYVHDGHQITIDKEFANHLIGQLEKNELDKIEAEKKLEEEARAQLAAAEATWKEKGLMEGDGYNKDGGWRVVTKDFTAEKK